MSIDEIWSYQNKSNSISQEEKNAECNGEDNISSNKPRGNNEEEAEIINKSGGQDNLHFLKSFLTEEHINMTFDEIGGAKCTPNGSFWVPKGIEKHTKELLENRYRKNFSFDAQFIPK